MSVKIFVNGKSEELEQSLNLTDLLKKKNIRTEMVVVELNDKIIEREKYDSTIIQNNDRIEFVYYMGGGMDILDLRGVSCPLNYVRTKLKLEELEPGQTLEVLLDDGEPVINVLHSAKEDGNEVLDVQKIDDYFKAHIKKS